jgi:hypothetical protein
MFGRGRIALAHVWSFLPPIRWVAVYAISFLQPLLIGWQSYVLNHLLSVSIDVDGLSVDLRLLGDEVHSSLSLLLLELEGDISDRTLLDSLHQVSDEAGNLVSKSLGGDDSNLLGNLLVQLEVQSELLVVLLNNVSGGSLNSLGSDSSHVSLAVEKFESNFMDVEEAEREVGITERLSELERFDSTVKQLYVMWFSMNQCGP